VPQAKTNKPRKRSASKASVARNVTAARDKIVDGVSGSFNVVLLTRKNIEEVIEDAVSRGRMTRSDAQDMLQNLLARGARATSDIVSDVERLIGRSSGEIDESGSKSSGSSLPIAGYDDLSAAEVAAGLGDLTPAELRKVRDYERRHANRKTVLDPIERKLR
jgi:hypothetical protein